MKISDINNASKIILDSNLFQLVIDKIEHKIIQTRRLNKEINEDLTRQCEQKECSIRDIVIDNPYTMEGEMIMAKILNNRADKKCMKFINQFKVMFE